MHLKSLVFRQTKVTYPSLFELESSRQVITQKSKCALVALTELSPASVLLFWVNTEIWCPPLIS